MIIPPVLAVDRFLVICPQSDVALVASDLGLNLPSFSPLYTLVDPVPRIQTHSYIGYKATEPGRVLINNVSPNYTQSIFEKYNGKLQNTYPQDRLLDLGLTVDPGNV